jgi:DCN1-like protein 1/2
VRKFMSFTQAGENTAIYCLSNNDWKLAQASDNYFQNPDYYCKEPKITTDRRKIDQIFAYYRGLFLSSPKKVKIFFSVWV